MKCLILAAGYATRMYPLTRNFPKPLLPINGKPLLEFLLEDIRQIPGITEILIVTNHRYYQKFQDWKENLPYGGIKLVDDGSSQNSNRLGAVRDMAYVISREKLNEDLLVIASDNLLDFSLKEFVKEFQKKSSSMVMYYIEKDYDKLKNTGVAELDSQSFIRCLEEKPDKPAGNCAVPPFYILKKEHLPLINQGINKGCNVDSPGSLLSWLCNRIPVYAMPMPGRRFDLGSLKAYEEIQGLWKNKECILITGAAGFIGAAFALALLKKGNTVIGLDNLNPYYDVELKKSRLRELEPYPKFFFLKGDLADKQFVEQTFEEFKPDVVVNLAAQAGVRYSIQNPQAYLDSNITGFFHILEAARKTREPGRKPVRHLLFASSSSIYGLQEKTPYSTEDKTDEPVSFYAATKKSNELMAHAYAKLYGIPCTGLRFFTVYGPKGRPDMAYYAFTEKILRGESIALYNNGNMYRDFTYIDDIVLGLLKVIGRVPGKNKKGAPYKIYNIGNSRPESLDSFVTILEKALKEEGLLKEPVNKEYLPMQPGDVYQTCADMREMKEEFEFQPRVKLEEGLGKFVRWYKEYHGYTNDI